MGNTTLLSLTKSNRNKKLFASGNHKKNSVPTEQRFRFSDLKDFIEDKKFLQTYNAEYCKLLVDIIRRENIEIELNKIIKKDDLCNYLTNIITKHFNIDFTNLYFNNLKNELVILNCLKDDVIEFDVFPFFKLKKIAPKLFYAFLLFVFTAEFYFLDIEESQIFNESSTESLAELLQDKKEDKKLKNEIRYFFKSYEKNKTDLLELKKYVIENKEIILSDFQNYNPKKEVFQILKDFIENALNYNFSLIDISSFENEGIEEEEEEEEYYENEYSNALSFHNAIYFKYSKNQSFSEEVRNNIQYFYENYGITNPCWKITKYFSEIEKNKQINNFKLFVNDYITCVNLLEIIY